MPESYAHVVQLRLTHEEWRLVAEMARLRHLTVEDLLREGLRLRRHEPEEQPPERAAHLRLVASGSQSGWRRARRRR